MKTLHLLSIVTTLGLASAMYAQAQTSSNTPNDANSNPQIADNTSQNRADAATYGSVSATQTSRLVGMEVRTASGSTLGQIKDVVKDMSGHASYAVIAYGATLNVAAKRTAVPWAAVSPMIQGDKLVMDQSQLEQAPILANSQKLDPSSGTWSRDANVYWRSVKMRSIDPQASSAPAASPAKQ
jgi:sporulation protein YlmC with PRC-barrel domain